MMRATTTTTMTWKSDGPLPYFGFVLRVCGCEWVCCVFVSVLCVLAGSWSAYSTRRVKQQIPGPKFPSRWWPFSTNVAPLRRVAFRASFRARPRSSSSA